MRSSIHPSSDPGDFAHHHEHWHEEHQDESAREKSRENVERQSFVRVYSGRYPHNGRHRQQARRRKATAALQPEVAHSSPSARNTTTAQILSGAAKDWARVDFIFEVLALLCAGSTSTPKMIKGTRNLILCLQSTPRPSGSVAHLRPNVVYICCDRLASGAVVVRFGGQRSRLVAMPRRCTTAQRSNHSIRRCDPEHTTTDGRRYQKVLWHHDLPGEPVAFYSEMSSGIEVRKVEIFRAARHDYADRSRSTGTTMLGEIPMPNVDEINRRPCSGQSASRASASTPARGGH